MNLREEIDELLAKDGVLIRCLQCDRPLQPRLVRARQTGRLMHCGYMTCRCAQENYLQRRDEKRRNLISRARRAGVPERFLTAKVQPGWYKAFRSAVDHKRGLYLFGTGEVGKTYVASALFMHWLEEGNGKNVPGHFLPAKALFDEILGTYPTRSKRDAADAVMGRYVSCGLLVIDDVGAGLTEAKAEIVRQLLVRRFSLGLPTIVISAKPAEQLFAPCPENGLSRSRSGLVSAIVASLDRCDLSNRTVTQEQKDRANGKAPSR